MRKIIASEFYSLDGLMSDPEDKMEWVNADFDPELGKYEDELYEQADTLILGRVTYKIFESYWPDAGSNPDISEGEIKLAKKINSMMKIVFSRTIDKLKWNNSKLYNKINPGEIMKMKQEKGKNILVIGSADIVRQLSNLGLIDEYHFALHPVILGRGKRLFTDINNKINLGLAESKIFKNGVILLKYINGGGNE